MIEWKPIETALDELPYKVIGHGKPFKSYADALVYGPTWQSPDFSGWPGNGRGAWTGEPRIAVASTYEGAGHWTINSDAPSDYDTYIQPTHWAMLNTPSGEQP